MSHSFLMKLRDVEWQVCSRQGPIKILESVCLTLPPQKIVTLIGPNGAGKTTLLKIILGLIRPTEGEILRAKGLSIGYMPQSLSINPYLPFTVQGMLELALPRGTHSWFPSSYSPRLSQTTLHQIKAALEEVGALSLLTRSLHALSGGERQRVLLARALMGEPNLLVLDEPAQGLDVNGQLLLYEQIERIRQKRGCGVVMVSHDLYTVMGTSEEVVCLNRHVCCSGSPETIQNHPSYQQLFPHLGAVPSSPLGFYQHHHDHNHDL